MVSLPSAAIVALSLCSCCLTAQLRLHTFDGDVAGHVDGFSVSEAGDVNSDGYADLIVGSGGKSRARVRVYSGRDGSILHVLTGHFYGDKFGNSVAGAGDVNGDGYADLIVGAPQHSLLSGYAKVFSGLDGRVLYTFWGKSTAGRFGASVDSAGDVNSDGYADLIVGAPVGHAIREYVRVFSGRDGSVIYTFEASTSGGSFGTSVKGAGDVNQDGYADVIVGAPSDNSSGFGTVRVYSGKDGSVLHVFKGPRPGGFFGVSVSGVGDINRDGHADLIVGDPYPYSSGGMAMVYSGIDGALLFKMRGKNPGDLFGVSVSGTGDVTGDGIGDFVVGAQQSAGFNSNTTGYAVVFSGKNGTTFATVRGGAVADALGFSVSGAGDVNRDGYTDIILGIPYDDNRGKDSGSAIVITLAPKGQPAYHRYHGSGCAGSNHHMPRITVDGRATLGGKIALALRGAVAGGRAFMLIGRTQALNLGSLGYPSCDILVSVLDSLPAPVDGRGFARTNQISVPNHPSLIGASLECQWLVVDPGYGIAVSNTATVHVGH